MVAKLMTKTLAPIAMKTAVKSTGVFSLVFFNQPKMPKKIMKTVK